MYGNAFYLVFVPCPGFGERGGGGKRSTHNDVISLCVFMKFDRLLHTAHNLSIGLVWYVFKFSFSCCCCVLKFSCSVRGRALTSLASAASSESSEVTDAVKRAVFYQTTTDPLVALPSSEPSELVILQMVRRRTTDEKVGVRKAALQALESLVRLDPDITRKEDVGVVYERCLDPALSVRKQAIVSLTVLLMERMDCSVLHK